MFSQVFNPPSYPRKAAHQEMDRSYTEVLPLPWGRESALTRLLLHDGGFNSKQRFHVLDVWHSFHLGIGKSWVASGAMMLQQLIPLPTVDERIAEMSRGYRLFCSRNHISPVINKLDIFSFGGRGNVERNGAWNKACVTSNLMLYLEDFCQQHSEEIQHDARLRIFVSQIAFLRCDVYLYIVVSHFSHACAFIHFLCTYVLDWF